ncbi:MAG: cyclic nucleotide-binding domain-containing protein [Planctomycetaceae bacterium]
MPLSIHKQIRHSSLGTDLGDGHIDLLATIATPVHYSSGQVVFSEGSAANAVSVMCAGKVALDMHVPVRGSVRILTLGPGDLLGWSAVAGDGVMTSTATALEDTDVLSLPMASLRQLCDADHTLGYALMTLVARSLAKRLRGTRLQMLDLFSETQPISNPPSGSVHR